MGKLLIFCLYYYILCRPGKKTTLMSNSDVLGSCFFRRKMEKTQPMKEKMDGKNEAKNVFLPLESTFLVFTVIMINIPFLIGTLTWRVNNSASRQEKSVNRRNESTDIFMTIVYHCRSLIEYICLTQLTVID